MKIDIRDKSNDQFVVTSYHNFFFGHSEAPKELDMFKTGDKNLQILELDGKVVHKGFYRAGRDFIKNFKRIAVELTKDEEAIYKSFEPEIYALYVKFHKNRFEDELILDDPVPKKPIGDLIKSIKSKGKKK